MKQVPVGKRFVSRLGKRYGKLIIIGKECIQNQNFKSVCKCDCGNTVSIFQGNLVNGRTRSCGCYQIACKTKHGMSGTSHYRSWASIRKKNNVCKRWKTYGNFREDVATIPEGMCIAAKHKNRILSKTNMEFVLPIEARRKIVQRIISYNGMKMNITQWSHYTGIKNSTLRMRLLNNWPIKKVLTEQPKEQRKTVTA